MTAAYGLTATPEVLTFGGGGIVIIIGGGGGNSPQNTSATPLGLAPLTAYHFRLKLTDTLGNSYYGADATFTTPTPVQGWRQQYFGTSDNSGDAADDANPSGDGIPNLMKYALNMDPHLSGTLPLVQLKDYNGVQYLSITFHRNPTKPDITYEVHAADSPEGPWDIIATSSGGAVTTGPGLVWEVAIGLSFPALQALESTTVEVRDLVSLQDAPRRFLRLQVRR